MVYEMNILAFQIEPCECTCDHQVRIIVDDGDWLGEGSLGIDPPDFFAQPELLNGGIALVGRCSCGCIGCSDVQVKVERRNENVVWTVLFVGVSVCFDASQYDEVVNSAMTDFRWEDENRTAERLISESFADYESEDGYRLDWVFPQSSLNKIRICFFRDNNQKIFDFEWEGKSLQSALHGAEQFKLKIIEQEDPNVSSKSLSRLTELES